MHRLGSALRRLGMMVVVLGVPMPLSPGPGTAKAVETPRARLRAGDQRGRICSLSEPEKYRVGFVLNPPRCGQ
jgi:hypothetical protein